MQPTLRDYQIEGVKALLESHGICLADDMGMGKTWQALFAAKERVGPYLVITRPLNKWFWVETIKELDPTARIVISGTAGVFPEEYVADWFRHPRKRGYLVTHHEALQYSQPKYNKQGVITHKAQYTLDFGMWEGIIADEAHRFKNRNAIMTKVLKRLFAYNKWALTGTPMEKLPSDLWSLLNWFNPNEFNGYWKFYEDYVEYDMGWHGDRKIKGVKNAEGLAKRIAPYFLRRTKETHATDLPPKLYKNIPLQMESAQELLYKQYCGVGFAFEGTEQEEFIGTSLAAIMKMRRIALDPKIIGHLCSSIKKEWLLDWATDIDEQFVILTSSKEFAEQLPLDLPDGVSITGDTKSRDRTISMSLFESGKTRYLVGTIDVLAEGLNLQNASIAIFTDYHTSSIKMQQAEDRIHRIGMTKAATIYRLLCRGTIDYVMKESIERKWSDIEFVRAAIQHARQKIHS